MCSRLQLSPAPRMGQCRVNSLCINQLRKSLPLVPNLLSLTVPAASLRSWEHDGKRTHPGSHAKTQAHHASIAGRIVLDFLHSVNHFGGFAESDHRVATRPDSPAFQRQSSPDCDEDGIAQESGGALEPGAGPNKYAQAGSVVPDFVNQDSVSA